MAATASFTLGACSGFLVAVGLFHALRRRSASASSSSSSLQQGNVCVRVCNVRALKMVP